MSLRETALSDLSAILTDSAFGFGWSITVSDPAGTSAALTGFSQDMSAAIDPDTNQIVQDRLVTVTLPIATLTAAGFEIPKHITSEAGRPWLVSFNDINGNAATFYVTNALPDRAAGCVVLTLGNYTS